VHFTESKQIQLLQTALEQMTKVLARAVSGPSGQLPMELKPIPSHIPFPFQSVQPQYQPEKHVYPFLVTHKEIQGGGDYLHTNLSGLK